MHTRWGPIPEASAYVHSTYTSTLKFGIHYSYDVRDHPIHPRQDSHGKGCNKEITTYVNIGRRFRPHIVRVVNRRNSIFPEKFVDTYTETRVSTYKTYKLHDWCSQVVYNYICCIESSGLGLGDYLITCPRGSLQGPATTSYYRSGTYIGR